MHFRRFGKYNINVKSNRKSLSRVDSSKTKKAEKYNHKNRTKFREMRIRERLLALDILACVGLRNETIESISGDDCYQPQMSSIKKSLGPSRDKSALNLKDHKTFEICDDINIFDIKCAQFSPMSSSSDLYFQSQSSICHNHFNNENDIFVDKIKQNSLHRPAECSEYRKLSNLSVNTLPTNLDMYIPPLSSKKKCKKSFCSFESRQNGPEKFKDLNFSASNPEIQSRPLPPLPIRTPEKYVLQSFPRAKNSNGQAELVKTIDLTNSLKNKWISGMAITRKGELIIADNQEVHIFDEDGLLKRTLGNIKGDGRLSQPLDITVLSNGSIAISDNAECAIKLFTSKGNFIRTIPVTKVFNIACIASTDNHNLLITSPDNHTVYKYHETGYMINSIPDLNFSPKAIFEHPYSLAVNPLSGAIVVGDDYKQRVIAVNTDGKILWRFSPVDDRLFFPSSISIDHLGYIFVADLCNEKVHMLDSGGKLIKLLLSRGCGLRGAPGVITTDDHGHLYVADEERTIKVFKYSNGDFTFTRRCSSTRGNTSLSPVRESTSLPDDFQLGIDN